MMDEIKMKHGRFKWKGMDPLEDEEPNTVFQGAYKRVIDAVPETDYAERLFKIKQLEYKRDAAQTHLDMIGDVVRTTLEVKRLCGEEADYDMEWNSVAKERDPLVEELRKINAQIAKLLED